MEMKYQIKYLPIAEQDITNIFEYIQIDNSSAALTLLNQFDQSISQLEQFPFIGSNPKDVRLQSLNYRMLIIENYLVFYVVIDNVVEIRRVLHGRRKYSFLI